MEDNYLGRQSQTGGPFQVLTRGQHAGSTVRRHVSHGFDSQLLTSSLMPGRALHIFNFVFGSTRRGLDTAFAL